MVKDILIKCAEQLGNNELKTVIKNNNTISSITNSDLQNDVCRMISFFNYTVGNLSENYLDLIKVEPIYTSSSNIIYFSDLEEEAVKIMKITDENNNNIKFSCNLDQIKILSSHSKQIFVKYKFIPKHVNDLNSKTFIIRPLNERLICNGIISEFLASKGHYNESEFWKNKYMLEVYKIRLKRGGLLKSTFCR